MIFKIFFNFYNVFCFLYNNKNIFIELRSHIKISTEHTGSFLPFFFFFVFSRATLEAYGGSQARGPIAAVAACLHPATATSDPSRVCDLHHSSQQCQILNPLNRARDGTHVLMGASQLRYC